MTEVRESIADKTSRRAYYAVRSSSGPYLWILRLGSCSKGVPTGPLRPTALAGADKDGVDDEVDGKSCCAARFATQYARISMRNREKGDGCMRRGLNCSLNLNEWTIINTCHVKLAFKGTWDKLGTFLMTQAGSWAWRMCFSLILPATRISFDGSLTAEIFVFLTKGLNM